MYRPRKGASGKNRILKSFKIVEPLTRSLNGEFELDGIDRRTGSSQRADRREQARLLARSLSLILLSLSSSLEPSFSSSRARASPPAGKKSGQRLSKLAEPEPEPGEIRRLPADLLAKRSGLQSVPRAMSTFRASSVLHKGKIQRGPRPACERSKRKFI